MVSTSVLAAIIDKPHSQKGDSKKILNNRQVKPKNGTENISNCICFNFFEGTYRDLVAHLFL